jgi:DNA-binding CsgD family transcriptional regulator
MQGRRSERAVIARVLDEIPGRGAALLIRGEAGVGKSTLATWAMEDADRRSMTIRRVAGVPSEQHVPFSGLQRLFGRRRTGDPVTVAERVLLDVHGREPADRHEATRVALATLDSLSDEAAAAGLLVVVEDVQWLDPDTVDVLLFVAHRIDWEPIVLLLALRDGHPSPLLDARLPEIRLGPLPSTEAMLLLDRAWPVLSPDRRARVLEIAAGNPLAILELPVAMEGEPEWLSESAEVPLTARLQEAFADRIPSLPDRARAALTIAALDEAGDLHAQLTAASILHGRPTTIDDLAGAERAGLVTLRSGIRFRHPLIRSAVHASASTAMLQRAHLALAAAYRDDPDRSVWHRALAAASPDAGLMDALVDLGERALRRGAPAVAGASFERAARVAPQRGDRASLLLRAAELAFEVGRPAAALDLVDEAPYADLGHDERARRVLLRELADAEGWSGAERVSAFAHAASAIAASASPAIAARVLLSAAVACWWGNPDQATRDRIATAVDSLALDPDEPIRLAALACADPLGQAREVIGRIRAIDPDRVRDPAAQHLLGTAASAVWAFDLAAVYLPRAVDGLRVEGRLASLAQALVSLCWTDIHRANAARALASATEAARLGRETGQARWAIAADIALAVVAGERGDVELAERLAEAADLSIAPTGTLAMRAMIRFARGRGAAAHQRYEEALESLGGVLDPSAVGSHPFVGSWSLADLIEAELACGRDREAHQHLRDLEQLRSLTDAPMAHAMEVYAGALLATDDEAAGRFADARLALVGWPCYQTRLLLHEGRWLRRRRRTAASREPLRAARDAADALGYRGLAEMARRELRASGETSRARDALALDRLSPQELQVAEMAATGMSNREIGSRLYLSHRTVASHLYRAFPKLGITARSELADAMAARPGRLSAVHGADDQEDVRPGLT